MTTIVCNTLTGAVSEYDWTFPALTASWAGSEDGLFELGGDLDNEAEIESLITIPKTQQSGSLKNAMEAVFVSMTGDADSTATLHVHGQAESWEYEFDVQAEGVSRARPGKGIKENYIGFGLANVDGADFRLDAFEVVFNESKQRRS